MNVANKVQIIDEVAFSKYLTRLNKSIHLTLEEFEETPAELLHSLGAENTVEVLELISELQGFGKPKGSLSWTQRVAYWNRDSEILANIGGELIVINEGKFDSNLMKSSVGFIPLFENYMTNKFYKKTTVKQEKETTMQNTKSVKSLMNSLVESNKDAAYMSAKLTAGKTANSLIQDKLVSMLPWYSRLFAKKKENPVAKLVTANIAVALTTHFAKDTKLKFVSDAMLQDAMVAMTRDSDMVDKFIKELTDAVKVPDSVLQQFNETNKS